MPIRAATRQSTHYNLDDEEASLFVHTWYYNDHNMTNVDEFRCLAVLGHTQ